MLTGFNQDVHVNGEIIHVQTEDKGRDKALVETLVYRGGTIIAAKRTSYEPQLQAGGIEDSTLGEMIKKQHQIIVAVIRNGKVDDLVRAFQKSLGKDQGAGPAPEPVVSAPAPPLAGSVVSAPPSAAAPIPGDFEIPQLPVPPARVAPEQAPPAPAAFAPSAPAPEPVDLGGLDAAGLDAVGRAVVDRISGPLTGELDLDKIISDYLQSGLQKEKLRLRLLGRTDFLAGDNVLLQVQATRGAGQPIEGASIVVKVIGTAFKPQVYPGRTDPEGVASFHLTLPTFTAGSAAIVVQASSKHGDGEIKHLIRRR
jgi:hypothetical protein